MKWTLLLLHVFVIGLFAWTGSRAARADLSRTAAIRSATPAFSRRSTDASVRPGWRSLRDLDRSAPVTDFEIESGPLTGKRILGLSARGNANLTAFQRDVRLLPDPDGPIGFSQLNRLPSIQTIAYNLRTLAAHDGDVELRAETIRSLRTGATDVNIRVLVANGPSANVSLPAGSMRPRISLIPGPHHVAIPRRIDSVSRWTELKTSTRILLALSDPLTGFYVLIGPRGDVLL